MIIDDTMITIELNVTEAALAQTALTYLASCCETRAGDRTSTAPPLDKFALQWMAVQLLSLANKFGQGQGTTP